MRIKDNLFSYTCNWIIYPTEEFQWHMHRFAMRPHTKHRLLICVLISYNAAILKWSTWVKIPDLIF